jgi:hypothetical protein
VTRAAKTVAAMLLVWLAGGDLRAQVEPSAGAGGPVAALSSHAREQLAAVYREKLSRSSAQEKLETALVYRVREAKKDSAMAGVPQLAWSYEKDAAGRLEVDVRGRVTAGLIAQIERAGGTVVSRWPQYGWVRAWLDLPGLERVADLAAVRSIHRAGRPIRNGIAAKKLDTSEGDVAHQAALARSQFGVSGSGVKLGVISDSVERLASLQASGDLGPVTVLPGQAGSGQSEGTAMLEIVHDLAPGAQLYFATAEGGEPSFANNILALGSLGCSVIVDDQFYLREPAFQDGIVAQAVNAVTAQGTAYFASAGNSGSRTSGSAGVWEGNFVDAGPITIGGSAVGHAHDFGGGQIGNLLTQGSPISVTLQWSDPFGAASNDYDLCVANASLTNVLGCSTFTQNGDDDPYEDTAAPVAAGLRLLVINRGGNQAVRFLRLATNRGRLELATSGATSGHSAAAGAFSVAAVNVATAQGGAFTGGAANPVEPFSSDGPRRVFFNPNGSAITPGNVLATGGTVRQKPDLAAADGVSTASGAPFHPFFGTSAAAPHAAAIAALMLSARPAVTLAELRAALAATALDIMAPGIDRDSGAGVLNAPAAVGAVLAGGGDTSPCVRDADTACLQGGRFEIGITWSTGSTSGAAQVMSFGASRAELDDSVFWWFFAPANFEIGVKVLNACIPELGNRYWVFTSGLTNQGWTVRVRDTQTGQVKIYSNPVGTLSRTFADTSAFACGGAP